MRLYLLCFALFLTLNSHAQVVGGHDNSNLIPSEAKPSTLGSGGLAGDVNLFTGDYNTSVPLGNVGTPGGLSYSLNLNYSTTYTAGTSPMVASGIPYGEGWNLSLPSISISNAAYYSFLQSVECDNNKNSPGISDSTNYYDVTTSEANGDIYLFSPVVNIPGYANGKAVFKYIDDDDLNCAVFVLNTFESYVELRFYGGSWTVLLDNGNFYTFDLAMKTYRSPNNQRVLDYNYYSHQLDNETHDVIENNNYGSASDAVKNVLEPKRTFTSWYCTELSNKNLPYQTISFDYKKFGAFNYFKAYEQTYIQLALGSELPNNLFTSSSGFAIPEDFTIYTDILLQSITSYNSVSPIDILELDYETSDQIGWNMLNPSSNGVHRKDSLYNYKTIISEGVNGNFSSNWNRYLHGKTDDITSSSPSSRTISSTNPYLLTNGNSNHFLRQTGVGGNSTLPFNHGFLETGRISADKLISGDTYEIKTKVIDGNGSSSSMGNGTIDISVVTGNMNVSTGMTIDSIIENPNGPDSIAFGPSNFSYGMFSQYNANAGDIYTLADYTATRGEQIYSTFDSPVKWHLPTVSTSVYTSNVFVMPSIPVSNAGINIQVGPGNSDHKFNKRPDDLVGAQIDLNNNSEVTAYNAYAHMNISHLEASNNIPSNFGIGMPWAMALPIYAAAMDGTNLSDPKLSAYNKFWWDEDVNDPYTWDNEPTKFNENVKLQEFELIRYSKNPYMLKSAKVYKVNGKVNPNDNSGEVLVSELALDYTMETQNLYENYDYPLYSFDSTFTTELQNIVLDTTLVMSTHHQQYVYNLTTVKSIPTGHYNADTLDNTTPANSTTLQTEFEYEWFGGPNRNSAESGFEKQINPGRSGTVLTKIIDQLGGETEIEYYPRSSLATLTGSYGLHRVHGCNTGTYVQRSYASDRAEIVHPSVKSIKQNENLLVPVGHSIAAPTFKQTDYVYDTTQIISETKDIILPSNFRKAFGYSRNKGFRSTTVLHPQLETGERNSTKYYHLGNVYQPYFDSQSNSIVDDPSTLEEYLFFGKLSKTENYNSDNELESSTDLTYGYTKAFENGYKRPLSIRQDLASRNVDFEPGIGYSHAQTMYEYADYYLNQADGKDTLDWSYLGQNWNRSFGEQPRLADVYFYNELEQINPEWKLHSYFIKLESKSSKTYDLTCSKTAAVTAAQEILGEFTISPNPLGDNPTNPKGYDAVKDPDLISMIVISDDGTDIKDSLLYDSPLSDSVLNAFIDHMVDFDNEVVYQVLRAQNPFNKYYLNRVFDNVRSLSPSQVIEIFRSQPFLTDTTQKHIIDNHIYSQNEILTALLTHNSHLSDDVLSFLIEKEGFPETSLYDVLAAQPQLNQSTLLAVSNISSEVEGANIAKVLQSQPAVPDAVFTNVVNNPSISEKYKVQIFSDSRSYPSDNIVIDFITPSLSTADIIKVGVACPYDMSDSLEHHIKNIIGQNNWQTIEPVQNNLNPYELYCQNPTNCSDAYIEQLEEYEYYEADYKGHTSAEGYKKMMGQDNEIVLKHEPSWQIFSIKKSSPQYPGAYSKDEHFYYFDVLNRKDRHLEFYDIAGGKAWYTIDTSTPNDTIVFLAGHSAFYQDSNLSGETPLPDGARSAQAHNLRQIAFQKTTFSKNNNDEAPLMKSSYYFYESKWRVPEIYTDTIIDFEGPSCPSSPGSLGCDDLIIGWIHGNGISDQTIYDNTPSGYCGYRLDPPFGLIVYIPTGEDIEVCAAGEYLYGYEFIGCYDASQSGSGSNTKYMYLYETVWDEYMFLKNVAVQIDTVPNSSGDWSFRLDNSNDYIAHFYVGENDTNGLSTNKMIYPFDTLGIRTIDEINQYGQIALEHNQSGIYTKYHYDTPFKVWYNNVNNNSNCPNFGSYGGIISYNIGLPHSITTGFGRVDAMTTSYDHYPNYRVKSVTNPNGIEVKYHYDNYSRLIKTFENDRLLEEQSYNYWDRNTNLDHIARTKQNYVDSYSYTGPNPTLTTYQGTHTRSFIDVYGRASHHSIGVQNDSTVLHSGLSQYDNWDRVRNQLKPHITTNQVATNMNLITNFTLNGNNELQDDYAGFRFENNTKSRPLRTSDYGINNINNIHTVKHDYSYVNKVQLTCDLNLNPYEVQTIINTGFSGAPLFIKEQVTDEDGKTMTTYMNAIGQKVAMLQYSNASNTLSGINDKVVTLFAYDSYGNLTKVINPEKQESIYLYNIMGQIYQTETIDAGTTKMMYNKLGLISVKQDENGKRGEYYSGTNDTSSFFTRYSYDDYGRLTTQQKAYRNQLTCSSNSTDNSKVDPLFYQDTISGLNTNGDPIIYTFGNTEQEYFEYKFSNQSTYDWLASIELVVPPCEPTQSNGSGSVLVTELFTPNLNEKWFQFGQTNTGNGLGKVIATVNYNAEGQIVQVSNFTYDNNGNVATESVEFNPSGKSSISSNYTTPGKTVTAKIHYSDYNYQRSLTKKEVDIGNDGVIDFQYHYNFDDWNRLIRTYFNFADLENEKVLVTSYTYDLITGLNTSIKHYNTEVCGPNTESESITPNQLIQTINKTYDVRNRLFKQSSELLNISLFYDNNLPSSIWPQNVNASQNWNGNINAMQVEYRADNSNIDVINDADVNLKFSHQTDYGYTYDRLNRLTKADAIQGNAVYASNVSTSSYGVGDAFYSYDKIGNILSLERGIKDSIINNVSQNILISQAWDYSYGNGNNHLTEVSPANTLTSGRSYTYDSNGNLSSDDHRDITGIDYYRGNYPYQINQTNEIIDYLYGTENLRMYKHVLNTNSNTTETEEYYLKDIGVLDMVNDSWTYYLTGLSREAKITPRLYQVPDSVSSYEDYPTGYAKALDISFYISDYLGNTRIVYTPIKNCGQSSPQYAIKYAADYFPYGKILREFTQGDREKYLTTQHERDNETGLDYRGARFYDSDVARFLSLDPKASDYPTLSDYVYVANNPIFFIDPDGKDIIPGNEVALNLFNQYVSTFNYTDKKGNSHSGKTLFGIVDNNKGGYTTEHRYSAKKMRKRLTKAGFSEDQIESGMNLYGALLDRNEHELVGIEQDMRTEDFYPSDGKEFTVNPHLIEELKGSIILIENPGLNRLMYLDQLPSVAIDINPTFNEEGVIAIPNLSGKQVDGHYSSGIYVITESEFTLENVLNKSTPSTDAQIDKLIKDFKKIGI